jgi:hypothetical protein
VHAVISADSGCDREIVKAPENPLIEREREARLTLAAEAVGVCHREEFVISAEKMNIVRIEELEGIEKEDNFAGIAPPVDVIAKEQIAGVGGISALIEDSHKRIDVSMDVTNDTVVAG